MKKTLRLFLVLAMIFGLAISAQVTALAADDYWSDEGWGSLEEYLSQGGNCMAVVVSAGASATGYPIFGHNEDDGSRNIVRHGWVEPKTDWPEDYKIPGNFNNDATSFPQVDETLGFYWSQAKYATGGAGSACGMLNEAGVFVASNANTSSKGRAGNYQDGGLWWNMRRSVAERATSARHAAQILADLSTNWGYNQGARAYTVVDNKEAWQVQLSQGQVYAAVRVPEGHVGIMSNHMTVKHLDYYAQFWPVGTDPSEYILYPSNIETLAGTWYDPAVQVEGLDYSWTFQATGTMKGVANTYRSLAAMSLLLDKTTKTPVWTGTDPERTAPVLPTVAVPANKTTTPEPWGEYEYPFSIEVEPGSVSVEDIYNIMTQHYEGWSSSGNGNWDARPTDTAGPGLTPHSGGTRRICTDTTDECDILEWTEDVKFTTMWTAFGRPCELPLVPLHPLAGYGVLAGLDNLAPDGGDTRFEVENHFVGDPKADLYFEEGTSGWAWQKFRDFQHMLDMCYSDLIDEFVPVRKAYFSDYYTLNQALITEGNLAGVQAFDQKALDDALDMMDTFADENMIVAQVTAGQFDIAGGSGNETHAIQVTLPDGKVPINVYFKWGGRITFTAGSGLVETAPESGVWTANLNLSRSNTAFAGKYDIAVGGKTSDGDCWAGILVLDAASSTHTKLIYTVAPEDQKGVIGRVPLEGSGANGSITWHKIDSEDPIKATIKANNLTGELSATAGSSRKDGFLQKEGYTLVGWKSDIPGDETIYKAGDDIILSELNLVTLTAVWAEIADTYTVTYTYDTGDEEDFPVSGEVPVDENKYLPGDEVIVEDIVFGFEKYDHQFDYWINPNDPDTKLFPGDKFIMGDEDVTLVAHFYYCGCDTPVPLTYKANGAVGNVPVDEALYIPQTMVYLLTKGNLTKGDETFLGWTVRRTGANEQHDREFYLDDEGNRQIFKPGEAVKMKGTGLTAIAQWSGGPGPDDIVPGEEDVTPPAIVLISPPDGATDVGISGDIVIVFDEAIGITGTVMLNDIELGEGGWMGNIYTIPYSDLEFDTEYTISVTGFKDLAGNVMAAYTDNSFTTVSDIEEDVTPPTVTSISPENGAGGVAISGSIAITFSEAIGITGTVMLDDIELGEGELVENTYTVSYFGLEFDTAYVISIAGFEDLAGNVMEDAITSSFTTIGEEEEDVTQPTVSSVSPENGATDVEISGNIVIVFSEEIGAIGTVMLNDKELGEGSLLGNTYTISYSGLESDTEYTIIISGFEDLAGNIMEDDDSYSFTTVAEAEEDVTPPVVVTIIPANGATGVAISGSISITFSEAMSTAGTVSLNDTPLTGASSWDADTHTIYTISYSGLAYSTKYTISITGFKDLAGNVLAANTTNSFTTRSSGGGSSSGSSTTTNASLSPATASFDKATDNDVTVRLSRGSYNLQSIRNGSTTLVEGTHYTISGNNVSIKADYLKTLSTGTQTLTFSMSGGTSPQLTITVTDTTTIEEQRPPLGDKPVVGTRVDATKTNNELVLNGETTKFPAVKIGGNNWLKLRDFAALLNSTPKQFSISYDESTGIIDIRTGQAYQPLGDELEDTLADMESAVASLQKIYVDGELIDVAAYNIKGYNYLRLRDLAIILNFAVVYDDESGQITLDFANPYKE